MTEKNPENRRLGYARVSTYGQTLDAQLAQLHGDGCSNVYREKVSGAQADRRELQRLLKAIQPGDVVTVTRIDRLARSTFDLFAIVCPNDQAFGCRGGPRCCLDYIQRHAAGTNGAISTFGS